MSDSDGVKIGIIGGSGLSNPDFLKYRQEKEVETPYGKPSDSLLIGEIKDVPCVLLERHGRSHSIMPTNVNYQANIWALANEGCTHLLAITACGSLQESLRPGDIVILDQFIDRTTKRKQTFFDGSSKAPAGICCLPMAEPFCARTNQILYDCATEANINVHKGTILTIEGPRFSSKAESKLWHSWGAHCINMTTVPEVILAREKGICYASIAVVTDYDSWRGDEEPVNVEDVLKTFKLNSSNAQRLMLKAIPAIGKEDWTTVIKANQDLVKMNTIMPHGN